jgi:REP element-mobilizing transposase RayT
MHMPGQSEPASAALGTLAGMQEAESAWFHVTLGTYNSWLPGDERGWRSRGHKRHSSGDHRDPPPVGEHAGIRKQARLVSGTTVVLGSPMRPAIGIELRRSLQKHQCAVLVIAVAATHAHILARLPLDPRQLRLVVGDAKRRASRAVKDELPGRIWAGSASFRRIADRAHQVPAFNYILGHGSEGAWVWCFRDQPTSPG